MTANVDSDIKVLVIDDEKAVLDSVVHLLSRSNYNIIKATGTKEGLALFQKERPLVVLTDLQMEHKLSGIEVLEQTKEFDADAVVILYTAHGDVSVTRDAFKKGAFDFIQKVQTHQDILVPIERAVKFARIQKENHELKNKLDIDDDTVFHGAVGVSPAILELFQQVKRVAQTTVNVLITGETGTGKEVVARGLHYYSKRREEPFVPVVINTLPDNLLEGELFGHTKGAFTGAYAEKSGLFEAANKGSIFLDEIGEVPMQTQPKLLRVLQERVVRRLGSVKERPLDVRIISATNQEPEQLIEDNQLREDLYFRLNVVRIDIPPLRERRDDIPVLAYHYLKKYRDSGLVHMEKISSEALMTMEEYDWPGNVRELQNAIESAVAVATRPVIRRDDLPPSMRPTRNRVFVDTPDEEDFKAAKNRVVQAFEQQYLENLLEKHNGNISKVAEAANLNRKTIYRMIETLGIDVKKR